MEQREGRKRGRVEKEEETGESFDQLITQLATEYSFDNRIYLMQQIERNLDLLSATQLHRLTKMISEDKNGLFNRTWGTLSFALKVMSQMNSPRGGHVFGVPVLRVQQWANRVGRGCSGSVMKAVIEDQMKAVKFLNVYIDRIDVEETEEDSDTVRKEKAYLQEILLLSQLGKNTTTQPLCVSLDGLAIGDNRSIGLVMPFYRFDLHRFVLHYQDELTYEHRLRIFLRCVECVDALHSLGQKGHLHSDIKPKNFLLWLDTDEALTLDTAISSLVITDFAFSEQRVKDTFDCSSVASTGGTAGRAKGTAAYASPEVAEGLREGDEVLFTKRSDLFSLGALLGFLISFKEPFACYRTPYRILSAIKQNEARFPPFPHDTPPLLERLFEWCATSNLAGRPSCCRDILLVIDYFANRPHNREQVQQHIDAIMSETLPLKPRTVSKYPSENLSS
ncbi:hypothetical protein QOT17_002067 [Balamuthia mandrillaris]